jgi:hypothetical protein
MSQEQGSKDVRIQEPERNRKESELPVTAWDRNQEPREKDYGDTSQDTKGMSL